ncbi:hypothetical protein GLYMA_08G079000v4 [Glycine max]|uniref:Uncharacterized protein n=2 Tax=Glycine subgen. Soja TaxID=1462606 RepID=A0A0R0IIM4_SOYBN|nr:hypothetical protein GYH30_020577 [Glycine max]KRH42257.1 hypothetical protein GLYMA_08G079000v4 [Glycine max]RZB95807.1 putative N-acetyl-gamma-glutamyl-phosphate reductase, chloroplastic [Glycine soja]
MKSGMVSSIEHQICRKKLYMYGLTEVLREEIKNSHLVANPGCYPTSVELPLVPLIKIGLIHSLYFSFTQGIPH